MLGLHLALVTLQYHSTFSIEQDKIELVTLNIMFSVTREDRMTNHGSDVSFTCSSWLSVTIMKLMDVI